MTRPGECHLPRGAAANGPFAVDVAMGYPSLRVLDLAPGASHVLDTGDEEVIVLPLAGAATVDCEGQSIALAGRADVFARVPDFCYLPRGVTATLTSTAGGRFALCGAPALRDLPVRYGPAADVPVELRGAGGCSRQVNNLAAAGGFECDRLIVVEVLTPGGNWSSYPPHKHDEHTATESELEEIYYFGVRGGGVGYQRVYGTAERPIDVLAEVRDGDVVLVPHGWHGPSIAAPGYDLYYLNVMAGPAPERAWRICDDPDHAWIRDTWADQPADPRLPLTGGA
ncbi:5-deoxy-glucuronate isomerase [Longispora fulva]|uniref:5-deoxy-glucuronate isomerase n=1 Tax=Longispora fulva TaxID=619741 RepID=A0A8J7G5Q3_9ACTN|nr:5-deoxy-glucuronate isomerase [Longispora fulva]MBG6134148.1 5-deoxy-glucuronate isomerase [Longispora fulva]GIG62521.1 5-deoxy-glucuronate isomerase [Longispora fulva]